MTRRDAVKLVGAMLAAGFAGPPAFAASRRAKKVVVAGGGIGGLSCAHELMERGHDVTVLEAAERAGGHVRTGRDYPDGLYADLGGEHCSNPGYENFRRYADKFGLELVRSTQRDHAIRFIQGKAYTEEMLADRQVLAGFGLNRREVDYAASHRLADLEYLFYERQIDRFSHIDQPFGIGLDELDTLSVFDLLKREGASEAAIRFAGGSKFASALQRVWICAVAKKRDQKRESPRVFRVKGGNDRLTGALAASLGNRVLPSCRLTKIDRRDTGVAVTYDERGEEKNMEADHLVCALMIPSLRQVEVTPAWPEGKAWLFDHMTFSIWSRVVFQCRSRFWSHDGLTPNLLGLTQGLQSTWEWANEVPSERGILLGEAMPGVTREGALESFKRHYRGRTDIEKVTVKDWFADPYSSACERTELLVGQVGRFWPEITRPAGRVHFVGAYADVNTKGMEAATNSGNRVARQIDEF